MSDPAAEAGLRDVAGAFALPGEIAAVARVEYGHINRTLVVSLAGTGGRYVFQAINTAIFSDVPALMENIARVTTHAAAVTPQLVPARDGRTYAHDPAGGAWRVFRFVEKGRSHQKIGDVAQAREVGRAFGDFQCTLATLPGPRLHEVLPGFHDTPRRYLALHAAIAADAANRVADVRAEIDFALTREAEAGVLMQLWRNGEIPERVVHNDTKLNNLLLDETSGRAVCVLDLDTVMPGLAPCDFGDMVRTASCAAAEDERDLARVVADPAMLRALAEGFVEATRGLLNAAEIHHLPLAGRTITLEQGVRFLADHIAGDTYYRVHRPGHNLDRARAQFALVRSLEAEQAGFERIVSKLAAHR